jgi:hypothetical protein
MLGLINQSRTRFNNPYALKALYCSYVRSILEYNSIVWLSIRNRVRLPFLELENVIDFAHELLSIQPAENDRIVICTDYISPDAMFPSNYSGTVYC